LLSQGWIDVTRARHPGERLYTFWVNEAAYRRNAGFRMDFLMANRDAYARVQAEGIDHAMRAREKPSDHVPVWMDLAA
jgi:exodeoxyribonuclease-3